MAKVEARPDMAKSTPRLDRRIDESLMSPGKYEIILENTISIDLHLLRKQKRWIALENETEETEEHQVVFRMWTYDEMIDMRKMATSYDPLKRMHLVDNDHLNRLKIQRLLVSWTLDRENPRLKLLHVNGVLADEGWQAFKRLQPNIITCILEEMNKVLEFGA